MDTLDFLSTLSNPTVSLITITGALLSSFILGVIISLVYKKTNQGFAYDRSFGFTLVMITVIVNSIMITIGSNIALSLGLIGSLSIIRFRTAIKNSIDMAFLFWCISVGLAVGASQYPAAIAVTVIVGVIALLFHRYHVFFTANTDYILTVTVGAIIVAEKISAILTERKLRWEVKSSFSSGEGSEITYSIYSPVTVTMEPLLAQIQNLDAVKNVTLLTPGTNLFV